ncbi:MAG: prohibitin family protein [Bacteroidota bacterium]|nr:prohibitin family protein [Bacteroidota bacterium]MDP4191940.1 prohibitin family protein [Bacteroidota bacterium]MDP4196909.1 prohibitin family protein [Bacteroidota bacterium]
MVFLISLLAAAVAFAVYISAKKRFSKSEATFAKAGFIVALLVAFLQIFTIVPAGAVGVVDFLGMVSENTLKPGVNFVNPLASVKEYSIKIQSIKETMTVPTKEGLSIQLDITLLYQINANDAAKIYKTISRNFEEDFLAPQFRSVVRGVTAKYDARALYTSEREQLSREMVGELSKQVASSGFIILKAPLRQIILPPGLTASIEDKLKAEQESQRMEFVLKKEAQEAERKRIEAKGIADFQDIVSKGISAPLLKWKGIEATEKLANSTNSKVIVIGSGKEGLPIILGNY